MSEQSPISPCVSICEMDPQRGWCVGCLRTLDEIARWPTMSRSQQQLVWSSLEQRRQSLSNPSREDL